LKIKKFVFPLRLFKIRIMEIKSLAVFCGSKYGEKEIYRQHAAELGTWMGINGITLIYGGGNKGIMADLSNAALAANGFVVGIIPKLLLDWEHANDKVSELIVVDDMHTRKKMLYEKCDAAVILSGGFGTLDELFEMITWNQLSIHNKKIFIINSGGFYTHLKLHMEHLQEEDFIYEPLSERILFFDDIETFTTSLK
jgi:uncharacterized protein (TIGR00730 family)